jgi:hypothetical protein
VISLNGGWTAGPEHNKPGHDLGYTRYEKKVEEGMVGFVNVKTDYRARATTVRFSSRET